MSAQSVAMLEDAIAAGRCLRCAGKFVEPSWHGLEATGLALCDSCGDAAWNAGEGNHLESDFD